MMITKPTKNESAFCQNTTSTTRGSLIAPPFVRIGIKALSAT
ncbi:MAG: hypothetical protein WDN76_13640 [Alphaproteobacteria bacterium]